ncbi:MAG: aminotransferase class I/II-fold pyridoxal phosphate-dependent enzyme [Parasporobacterium sp.]|nr:aminotransferase class I/II-fold pyridoxal phosphate-dependent enzyme [Parasporobacterium sp.]
MRSNHGGDIYRNRVTYDFSVNVNPYGMPQSCKRAIIDSLSMASCYPDCERTELREKIAKKELGDSAAAENVILGNGASELIYAACQAILPLQAMVTAPTFKEYETAVRINGGAVLYETLEEKDAFVLTETILDHITEDVELLFLCNPNNPTGQIMSRDFLFKIAARCEETETWFMLDECFLPFMEEEGMFTMKDHLKDYPHLMILKAYTKIYGMAGIRFGYLLSANTELLTMIRGVIQPWNVSIPAQAAAMAALQEDEYVEKTKKLIKDERAYLISEMRRLGVDLIGEPAANYIFFKGEADLADRFLERGILIRSCSNYTGLTEGFYRIGVRSPEENRALIGIWEELKKEETGK